MRYIISYDEIHGIKTNKLYLLFWKNFKFIISGAFAVIIVSLMLIEGVHGLIEYDKTDAAKSALNNMASNIKDGEGIGEALKTFCDELFIDADG